MLKKTLKMIPIQFFGDGGDGGSSGGDGAASASGVNSASKGSSEHDIPAFVPERARHNYRKAQEIVAKRQNPESVNADTSESEAKPDTEGKGKETDQKKMSYRELIKSPEYAEEHNQYVKNMISERLSKYKGIEEELERAKEQLGIVGGKYGLDPSSETFFDDLKGKMDADSDFFTEYAIEHDIPEEEARNIAQLKSRLARHEREAKVRAEREESARQLSELRMNADRTKALYPSFNLDTEMQNPKFRQLCATLKGDTTMAYRMSHYDELHNAAQREASERARRELSASIASGQSRPIENGLSKTAASGPSTPDFSRMNTKQLREYFNANLRGK